MEKTEVSCQRAVLGYCMDGAGGRQGVLGENLDGCDARRLVREGLIGWLQLEIGGIVCFS